MIQTIVDTPKPPYYAVIFTSMKIDEDRGYDEISARMVELVSQQDGFLGFESAREEPGITVSYWRDEKSIQNWKANLKLLSFQILYQKIIFFQDARFLPSLFIIYFLYVCRILLKLILLKMGRLVRGSG